MNKFIKYIMVLAVIVGFAACQEDYEPGGTAVQDMAGTWWVNMSVMDADGNLLGSYGYYQLLTYNTSDNSTDSMWVTDDGNFWDYKVKVGINYSNKTFTINEGKDLIWDDNTTIENGKIMAGAATAPSGTVTDSIYFEVQWASDPGYTYIGSGYRYTGWPEDDH
ncbi:lipid-binding protein [Saccharicrinis sp. FJH62]|uniref:lipid-binding protein n=1 Tax=Saccharicrinis sp. FJH62 TaxID=3344657 RepID=UPI0035D506E9